MSLHRHYVMWCEQEAGDIPCLLSIFHEWLTTQGFHVERGLVYGVVLKVDLPAATAAGGSASA